MLLTHLLQLMQHAGAIHANILPEEEDAIGVVEILDLHRTYGHADCFGQSDGRALVAHIRAVRQIV